MIEHVFRMCILEMKCIESRRHTQARRIDVSWECSSRQRASRNTRHWPAAVSPSGTAPGLAPPHQSNARTNKSSASTKGVRSKVITEQSVVSLKTDYIYISDRQLFWFGDRRYLHLVHNGILHFHHKALKATKWIFDLGSLPHYHRREDAGKSWTDFFFFNWGFALHEGTNVADSLWLKPWFSWMNKLPSPELTTFISLFWDRCCAQ